MFVQAKELHEGDIFDMEPLLHLIQDAGAGDNITEEDWDEASFELARVDEIEHLDNGLICLHTDQGSWNVHPDTLIDYQGVFVQ